MVIVRTVTLKRIKKKNIWNELSSPEMEVDREHMDLNNSSRTIFVTMELVDLSIFTTFYFVFHDFLFYFTSTAPRTILHIHAFKSSHFFT